MTPDDPRHGTPRGYNLHRRANEDACHACLQAIARYQKRRVFENHRGIVRRVPLYRARRRIEALMRLGWNADAIAQAGGWNNKKSIYRIGEYPYVTPTTFARVCRAYDELSGRRGPCNVTRGMAEVSGYAAPLAWDDIDNPRERPKGIATRPAAA